jgi:hypothetical protein
MTAGRRLIPTRRHVRGTDEICRCKERTGALVKEHAGSGDERKKERNTGRGCYR